MERNILDVAHVDLKQMECDYFKPIEIIIIMLP